MPGEVVLIDFFGGVGFFSSFDYLNPVTEEQDNR